MIPDPSARSLPSLIPTEPSPRAAHSCRAATHDLDYDGEIVKMDLNGRITGRFGRAGKLQGAGLPTLQPWCEIDSY